MPFFFVAQTILPHDYGYHEVTGVGNVMQVDIRIQYFVALETYRLLATCNIPSALER